MPGRGEDLLTMKQILLKVKLKAGAVGALLFVGATLASALNPAIARAAVQNPAPAAQVSFTFDDGQQSAYTNAAPMLQKYGLSGTNYVITNCVGMTTVPNTCRANKDVAYMSWAQIQDLQNTFGWEIGSHTVDHKCLASNSSADPGDCQNATLTPAQVDAELANSKSTLAANGINATDFAPPYGDYNNSVLAEIAKYYATMRQFKNAANNVNVWPYSDYYLQDVNVQEGVDTVDSLKAKVDAAIANKQWLVLTFHDIESVPSTNPDDYQFGTAELDQVAAYVQTKISAGQIKNVHVNQGLVGSDTNLLANDTFNDGIAGGWTTDSANVTADGATNGSFPDPTNSVQFTGGTSAEHLFSPQVSVDPNTTYLLKNFLDVKSITSGEIGYYIDEYDANGNWISGQWKTAENSAFVEDLNFTYKPSSANVSRAALQIYTTANSGVNAYVDNAQWFPLSSTSPANLALNGSFDNGMNNWSTDDATNIVADSGNHGSPENPINSASLTALPSAQNIHLFSTMVNVSPSKNYNVSSWLNITSLSSGEVGFYIDEYDASGNWISGQYITGDHTVGANTVGFTYTPSSSSVAKASLQVIVVGNSGIHAYFDDVKWYQN
jgi:peptidoglycan/xylan/chitin deacetylase (PgdA/CDA1 family)